MELVLEVELVLLLLVLVLLVLVLVLLLDELVELLMSSTGVELTVQPTQISREAEEERMRKLRSLLFMRLP